MIKLKIILFVLTTSSVYCQNRAYLRLINAAELNITENEFASAFENYGKAFQLSDNPKAIDLVNSLKCACLLKKANVDKLLIKIFQKGLTYNDLFFKEDLLKKCLSKRKLEIKPPPIDLNYRTQINNLNKADQFFRTKTGSYRKYQKQIDSVDKKNVKALIRLIEKKGFPSESRIGVETVIGYQGWEIVVWHYQQQRSRDKSKPDLFSGILMKALQNDEISPLVYATYVELQNDSIYLKYITNPLIILDKDEYRILKSTLEKKDQINASREAIGMNSLEDDIKKIIYQRKNKYQFNFGFDGGYFDLTRQEKSVKKKLKERTVKLDFKMF